MDIGSPHLSIKLLFAKKGSKWSLVSMDVSDGVPKLLGQPAALFDPNSKDPAVQHVTAIISQLEKVELDGGIWYMKYEKDTCFVFIEIKQRSDRLRRQKSDRTSNNGDDEDVQALSKLREEAIERLAKEEGEYYDLFKDIYRRMRLGGKLGA